MLNYQRQPVLLSFSLPVAVPLPDPSELPDSDDTPVDNELQQQVPSLLKQCLEHYWRDRHDWFFGINMGIYHHTPGYSPSIAIVPDGFLSVGVTRPLDPKGRLSYIVWKEHNVVPLWVLECVSQTYGEEYDEKMTTYRRMGVLYYTIYNPHHHQRDQHAPLEVYQLVKGQYQLQPGPRVWLPKLQLALGRERDIFGANWEREWLYWYDQQGQRLPTHAERAEQERQQAEQERQQAKQERQQAELAKQQAAEERQRAEHAEQRVAEERQRAEQAEHRAERLAALLRAHGLDPDQLS
jgi:Uma2 family endonuclease